MASNNNEIKTESDNAKKFWEQGKKDLMTKSIENAFKIPKSSGKSLGDSIPNTPSKTKK